MQIELGKLKPMPVMALIILLLTIFLPGGLFLFIFERELFFKLDIFRLILIALSITTPFLVTNMAVLVYNLSKDNEAREDPNTTELLIVNMLTMFTCLLTYPALYMPILIGYFLGLRTREVILIAIGIQIITSIFFTIDGLRTSRNNKKG